MPGHPVSRCAPSAGSSPITPAVGHRVGSPGRAPLGLEASPPLRASPPACRPPSASDGTGAGGGAPGALLCAPAPHRPSIGRPRQVRHRAPRRLSRDALAIGGANVPNVSRSCADACTPTTRAAPRRKPPRSAETRPCSQGTTAPLATRASVALRQSSRGQVGRPRARPARPYHRVERAPRRGGPAARVEGIDEALGQRGAAAEPRSGGQWRRSERGLGRVGGVVRREASRRARHHREGYERMAFGALVGTLRAARAPRSAPRCSHDRLLRGLSGLRRAAAHRRELTHLNN